MNTVEKNDIQSESATPLPPKKLQLEESWKVRLAPAFEAPHMKSLREFLELERQQQHTIFPRNSEIFNALNTTPFEQVRIVILGQDPYHGPGQAHGLSFSVKDGVPFPPSLENIFKELESDLQIARPRTGDLTAWAKQGVLLLNATLTVRASQAGSHQKKGWEEFTDRIIHLLNDERSHIVFILWGSYAQKKASFIDLKKHLVIASPHPSPLSSYRGFFGSKPFSKANGYLKAHKLNPIDWTLS
jgi:uracil-DNA glycosylase